MKYRSEILKARRAMLLTGVMLMTMGSMTGALAADQAIALKAPPPPEVGWYTYGDVEVGGRFFIDRPPTGFGNNGSPSSSDFWLTPRTTESRAKFNEYNDLRPGPFGNLHVGAASRDGWYNIELWAKNIGYRDQSYLLDFSQAGVQYLTVAWDQIPHTISTSAKTIFTGVGTTQLNVDPGLRATLNANFANANLNNALGVAARANIEAAINGAAGPLELRTLREKGSIGYRATPNDSWDFNVDYTHEHRTGIRPTGLNYGGFTGILEIPQPIDDLTQNVSASGQYVGVTPWGTRWTTALRYAGSFFSNDIDQIDIQNPFCFNCAIPPAGGLARDLRLASYADNQANAVTWQSNVDLPFLNTKYMSTVQYNMMRQNDPFVSTVTNGLALAANALTRRDGTPVSSLNGEVNTLLFNNALTSQLTKDLKLTLRGRHYDVDNQTPSLQLNQYIAYDTQVNTLNPSRLSLPISYTKDNASAELAWRMPAKWLTVGGGYFFERWDRHLRDANVTDEHMGKIWLDAVPIDWAHARASYQYSQRRYDEYNVEEFVEAVAGPGRFSEVVSNMRKFDLANRNRHKAEALLELAVLNNVSITPNAGLRFDDYPESVFNQLGFQRDNSWNVGAELGLVVSPALKLMASYNFEERKVDIKGGSGGVNFGTLPNGCPTAAAANPESIIGPTCTWGSDHTIRYNTFIFAADWKAIPNRLDFRFEYLAALGNKTNDLTPCTVPLPGGAGCAGLNSIGGVLVDPALVNFGQFPTEKTELQRFSVLARYFFDPNWVRQWGWKGEVVAKVRYVWERNHVTNWAIDNMTPYIPTPDTNELSGGSRSVFLAAFNPNYTAQYIAASLGFKW